MQRRGSDSILPSNNQELEKSSNNIPEQSMKQAEKYVEKETNKNNFFSDKNNAINALKAQAINPKLQTTFNNKPGSPKEVQKPVYNVKLQENFGQKEINNFSNKVSPIVKPINGPANYASKLQQQIHLLQNDSGLKKNTVDIKPG